MNAKRGIVHWDLWILHESSGTKGFRASLFSNPNSFSSVPSFFWRDAQKGKLFSFSLLRVKKIWLLVILKEQMRAENGDKDNDKWRLLSVVGTGKGEKHEQLGHSDGTVNWFGTSLRCWQVTVSIYITAPDNSHISR